MPRKGQAKPRLPVGDTRDPDSLYYHMLRFSGWQREKNYSERTVENREDALRLFIGWAHERGLTRPQEISKPILERYQRRSEERSVGKACVSKCRYRGSPYH